ncbi:MAG: DUF3806 domain-containing protein, partial [Pseudomonadales bacterium]|nr:DUF3806 domain-containing protein [Pseudomonadales bacterium]
MNKTFKLYLMLTILSCLSGKVFGASEPPVQTLTPEELENYQFASPPDDDKEVIKALNVGQMEIMNAQRRSVRELFIRKLGILSLKGDKRDLPMLQQLVDRRLIHAREVKEWQAIGVYFGDILVREFGLHWVVYEDKLGSSKALQWRSTENYVFPVTLFSKRNYFNEKIIMEDIYRKLEGEVERFKRA